MSYGQQGLGCSTGIDPVPSGYTARNAGHYTTNTTGYGRGAGRGHRVEVSGGYWTRVAESNRPGQFCRLLPRRLANARDWCPLPRIERAASNLQGWRSPY